MRVAALVSVLVCATVFFVLNERDSLRESGRRLNVNSLREQTTKCYSRAHLPVQCK